MLSCDYCGNPVKKRPRTLAHVFCNRTCAGMFRRKNESRESKRAKKAAYDREYRSKNLAQIRQKKHNYHKRTYDPIAAAVARKTMMPRHLEYCRKPEYRKKKAAYDEKRRATIAFGEFAESFLLLKQIDLEVSARASDYEIRLQQGALNKKQKRERNLCQKQRRNRSNLRSR